MVAQDDAVEALRFGLEVQGSGQNIFIRGLTGTGRSSLVRQLLGEVQPACDPAPDRCYVRNFVQPDQPGLLSFPRGRAIEFRAGVEDAHVLDAVRRGRHRADLPARHYRKLVTEGTIRGQTEDRVIGQINGLAVVHAGPLTYGFPTRITATIGPGTAGAINIEHEAELSGAIHTKGFYILGDQLRHLLHTARPLAFSAAIAFEQSYGGIDGDFASGAEMCCLVSALTGSPLDQGLVMTGAIDQHGHIQPIGAVSEKLEEFFAVCRDRGLNGRQGVLIPALNAGDLMLNRGEPEACENGQFSVYSVDTTFEAQEVLTRQPVPSRGEDGRYPAGTLLDLVEQRARDYWRLATAMQSPPGETRDG